MKLELGEHTIDCTNRTVLMGILNVSDDSPVAGSIAEVSGTVTAARDRGLELHAAGARIVDIGAHSTGAGKRDLTAQEEIERVCPVIEALRAEGVPVSVDTWNADVASAAAGAGVHLLNDVTGFTDPAMVAVAADHHLPVCVMQMRGDPKMHYEVDQTYEDVAAEVRDFLFERTATLEAAGAGQVWIDPGFGFGKSADDNVRMLADLPGLVASGRPVLVSASRKGFLAELLKRGNDQDTEGILEATLAFNTLAAYLGAHVVRVHDVDAVADAIQVVNRARAAMAEASG
ncbi:MAG: dihydropteroate synthase [Dehalococcoidia bacterium]|jgi:dihydropteroate synthase|nr:dihydropteroate synthase [Dehalococcoidia bacterium]